MLLSALSLANNDHQYAEGEGYRHQHESHGQIHIGHGIAPIGCGAEEPPNYNRPQPEAMSTTRLHRAPDVNAGVAEVDA